MGQAFSLDQSPPARKLLLKWKTPSNRRGKSPALSFPGVCSVLLLRGLGNCSVWYLNLSQTLLM